MAISLDTDPKLAEYAHPERLVTTEWLAERLGQPGLVVVESDEAPQSTPPDEVHVAYTLADGSQRRGSATQFDASSFRYELPPLAEPAELEITGGDDWLGPIVIEPIEYDDPEMECHKFVAHAAGSDGPYMKSPGEQYMVFNFKAPWTGMMYQRAIKLVIDPNSTVIHHWLLFKLSGPTQDGQVTTGSGTHPIGILLHGWAPGASPIYLDPDVGVELPGDVGYQLRSLEAELVGQRPALAFFRGTPALGAADAVTRLVPMYERRTLLTDPAPRIRPRLRQESHAN